MTDYAAPEDIAARLGRGFDEFDSATVRELIAQGAAVLRASSPGLQARIDDGLVEADLVRSVVVAMVTRAMRNRLMLRSATTGPFSADYPDDGSLSATLEELALLRPRASGPLGVGTIRLRAPLLEDAAPGSRLDP